MAQITALSAHEILDSRGEPTLEVLCSLASGAQATASVPAGKSTGSHEAHELRDGDPARYAGKGVLKAVHYVGIDILSHLSLVDHDQQSLDMALRDLDGTVDKSRLGANTLLAVSLSFAKAVAKEKGQPLFEHLAFLAENDHPALPGPMLNLINGGAHSQSGLDLQEFLILPHAFDSFRDRVQAAALVIDTLEVILKEEGYGTDLGDEGGFAPRLSSNEQAFELIDKAIKKTGHHGRIDMGMDAAATHFYHDGSYVFGVGGKEKKMKKGELLSWYTEEVTRYPIRSIEDGFAEEDWEGFASLTRALGDRVLIVGDDLTVTNVSRIEQAATCGATNAILIKPNQIGTLTETIKAVRATQEHGWKPIVSHRSGETMDTLIADLAVGLSCPFIKAGSLRKEERMVKYERLIEIEKRLVSVDN